MTKNDDKTPKLEIIYALTNEEGMPGLVKIGSTVHLPNRLAHLKSASPYPFEVGYAIEVAKEKRVERLLHDFFRAERFRPRREFFEVELERVIDAMRLVLGLIGGKVVDENHIVGDGVKGDAPMDNKKDIAETAKAAQSKRMPRPRLPNFRFDALGIPIGAVLTFSGKPEVTAIVKDGKNAVEFEGKTTTLSEAATKILGTTYAVNGALYWEYDGETIDVIRKRKAQEAKTKARKTKARMTRK